MGCYFIGFLLEMADEKWQADKSDISGDQENVRKYAMAAHRSYQRHRRKMNLWNCSLYPDILLSPVFCCLLPPFGWKQDLLALKGAPVCRWIDMCIARSILHSKRNWYISTQLKWTHHWNFVQRMQLLSQPERTHVPRCSCLVSAQFICKIYWNTKEAQK